MPMYTTLERQKQGLVKEILLHLYIEISASIKNVIGEDSDTENKMTVDRGEGDWGTG